MTLDLTNFAPALKSIMPTGRVQGLTYPESPAWARVKKVEDFYGSNMVVPFRFSDPESRSRTTSVALNARLVHASRFKSATVTRGHDFAAITIDRETIAASSNNVGAFLKARESEIKGMLNALGRSLGVSFFADGSGRRGQISAGSNVATSTITLAEPDDITNIELGQALQAFQTIPNPGVAPTLRASGAIAYVVGVDRGAGTITVSGTINGAPAAWSSLITGVAAGDFLLAQGDGVGFSSTSNSSAIAGLGAWLPWTAPTLGDNFFGVDRSADVTRLGGVRYVGTGLPMEEALLKCASRLGREGGRPTVTYMNFNQYSNLVIALGTRVRYIDFKVADVGFSGIRIHHPKGEMDVVPDMNCPNGFAYMIQEDTWEFHSLLSAPHIVTEGNFNGELQENSLDAIQVRACVWGQLVCTAPGYNAVLSLDT